MKTKNKIEELKSKIAEFEANFNKAQKEVEHYRKLSVKYNEKLQEEILRNSVEKYGYLLGKYWKCNKTEEDRKYTIFVFVKDIQMNEVYCDEVNFICESIEYCHDRENGELHWYSYMTSCDYSKGMDTTANFFDPDSLIEITKEEFLANKKV